MPGQELEIAELEIQTGPAQPEFEELTAEVEESIDLAPAQAL